MNLYDKNICDKVQKELFLSESGELSEDFKKHIENCDKCKKEYDKFLKMRLIVSDSAPSVPDLRQKVLGKIKNEQIKISEKKTFRRHIPLGTIAAAAAVLAVYVSIYGTKIPDMIFSNSFNDSSLKSNQPLYENSSKDQSESGSVLSESNLDSAAYQNTEDNSELLLPAGDENSSDMLLQSSDVVSDNAAADAADAAESTEMPFTDNYSYSDDGYDDKAADDEKSFDIRKGGTILMSYPNSNILLFVPGINAENIMEPETQNDNGDDGTEKRSLYDNSKTQTDLSGNSDGNNLSDSGNSDSSDSPGLIMNPSSGDGSSGTDSAQSNSIITDQSEAEKLFESMSEKYPGRISKELFDEVGENIYISFVNSLSDYESGYTAEALKAFAENYMS